jgi:5-formyltetrahydrofolate cyclo-ligase
VPTQVRDYESETIVQALLAHPEIIRAHTVHVYLSMPTEVDTGQLIDQLFAAGKRIIVPWMNVDRTMSASELLPEDVAGITETGRLRVPQAPVFRSVEDGCWDVVIVPLVAATVAGDRMGNGAGHYDRLLSDWPCPAIGVALSVQVVESVPLEPHDVKLTALIHPSTPTHQPNPTHPNPTQSARET